MPEKSNDFKRSSVRISTDDWDRFAKVARDVWPAERTDMGLVRNALVDWTMHKQGAAPTAPSAHPGAQPPADPSPAVTDLAARIDSLDARVNAITAAEGAFLRPENPTFASETAHVPSEDEIRRIAREATEGMRLVISPFLAAHDVQIEELDDKIEALEEAIEAAQKLVHRKYNDLDERLKQMWGTMNLKLDIKYDEETGELDEPWEDGLKEPSNRIQRTE